MEIQYIAMLASPSRSIVLPKFARNVVSPLGDDRGRMAMAYGVSEMVKEYLHRRFKLHWEGQYRCSTSKASTILVVQLNFLLPFAFNCITSDPSIEQHIGSRSFNFIRANRGNMAVVKAIPSVPFIELHMDHEAANLITKRTNPDCRRNRWP